MLYCSEKPHNICLWNCMKNDQVNSKKINDPFDKVECGTNLYSAKILTHPYVVFIYFFFCFFCMPEKVQEKRNELIVMMFLYKKTVQRNISMF